MKIERSKPFCRFSSNICVFVFKVFQVFRSHPGAPTDSDPPTALRAEPPGRSPPSKRDSPRPPPATDGASQAHRGGGARPVQRRHPLQPRARPAQPSLRARGARGLAESYAHVLTRWLLREPNLYASGTVTPRVDRRARASVREIKIILKGAEPGPRTAPCSYRETQCIILCLYLYAPRATHHWRGRERAVLDAGRPHLVFEGQPQASSRSAPSPGGR